MKSVESTPQSKVWLQKLYDFLMWWTTPTHKPESRFLRRRLRLLLTVLTFSTILSLLGTLFQFVVNEEAAPAMFVGFISGVVLYVIARWGTYQLTAAAVAVICLLVPYAIISLVTFADTAMVFILSNIGMLLVGLLLFNGRHLALLLIISISLYLVYNLADPTLTLVEATVSLVAILPFAALTLVISYMIARDNDDYLAVQQNSVEREANLRQIIEAIPQIVLVTRDNQILLANRQATHLMQQDPTRTLVGDSLHNYLQEMPKSLSLHTQDSLTFQLETELLLAKQTPQPVHVIANAFNYQNEVAILWLIQNTPDTALAPTNGRVRSQTQNGANPLTVALPTTLDYSTTDQAQRYEMISELISDYAYAQHVENTTVSHFLWITGAYQETTGHSLAELMQQQDWLSLIAKDDQYEYQVRQTQLLAGDASVIDYRIVRPDGQVRWVRDSARPIWTRDNQEIYQIIGAAHDITERVTAEEALKSLIVQQAVVAELGLLALAYDDLHDLLDHALVLIEQVLQISACDIQSLSEDGKSLMLITQSGLTNTNPTAHFSIKPDASQAAFTLAALEPVIASHLKSETRFASWQVLHESNIQSSASLIIYGQKQPYGVLSVHSQQPRVFTEDDVYFLQSLANVLGTFIERFRARQAERTEREFAEALRDATVMINSRLELPNVLDKMLEFVSHAISTSHTSSIMLRDSETGIFRIASLWKFPPVVAATADEIAFDTYNMPLLQRLTAGENILIPDVHSNPDWYMPEKQEWIQAYLGAPIMVEDGCIGVINLNSTQVGAFTQADMRRLRTFADKTGNAILNARRSEDLARTVAERTSELRSEQERLRAILEGTADGIFYTVDDEIHYTNTALCTMTGYRSTELDGKHQEILWPDKMDSDELEKIQGLQTHLMSGEIWRSEMQLQRHDGSHFDAGLTISRVSDVNEPLLRAVTIVRDISAAKELDRKKGRFLANAAHELRSPLTAINTSLYMIRRNPSERERYLERIQMISDDLNSMVANLLDISYFETGKIVLHPENIILQDLLEHIVVIQRDEAAKKNLPLEASWPEEPISLLADRSRLQQVFRNLLTNAIRYTDDGHIIVRACLKNGFVEIDFEDTGCGIAPENLENIFQPFFREDYETDQKGAGLGLSIAKEIVERHDGTITVQSSVSVGTTFTVCLPLLK